MVGEQSKKKKIRWMQNGVSVAVPSTRRQARRGTTSKRHRPVKARGR